ncbi:MAG TPA: hypothetical protein VGM03_08005 [Phycisphaerae bacterium]|jgi:hypothetical protein
MSVEAYIPSRIEFAGVEIAGPTLVTLYNPDSAVSGGSLTASKPPPAGCRGRLVVEGTRAGKLWSIVCPEIEVHNKSALGCEFHLLAAPQRTVLQDLGESKGRRKKGMEEQFDIR